MGTLGHGKERLGTFGQVWQSVEVGLGYRWSILRVSLEYIKSILKAQNLPRNILERVIYVILAGVEQV